MNKGKIFILSGPSGSGKDTLMAELFKKCPEIKFSISSITRPMRVGEVEGEKYNFISREKFEEMLKNDFVIGGEQSGHIIFKDFATTGDGQLTGVQFASIMARTGKSASELASIMQVYPQTMVNVSASPELKNLLKTDEEIKNAIDSVAKKLGDDGRILVRASGTEPLIRVMLEGKNIKEIAALAEEVAAVIKSKG